MKKNRLSAYFAGFIMLITLTLALSFNASAGVQNVVIGPICQSGIFTYTVTDNGQAEIMYCAENIPSSLTIPSKLDGYTVASIRKYAFSGRTDITSITLPSSIKSIGIGAFGNCTALRNVYITDIEAWCAVDFEDGLSNPLNYAQNLYLNGSLVTNLRLNDTIKRIKPYTFYGYKKLTSVTVPRSATSIGTRAFFNCTGLTNVTILDGTVSIGSYAFYKCTSLIEVRIPQSVTSIGEYAFEECTGLTYVYINDFEAWCNINFSNCYSNPLSYGGYMYLNGILAKKINLKATVEKIKPYAFYGYKNMTSITIPDSVSEIGKGAFSHCSALTSITIPDSVTSIGSGAFYDCSSLKSITLPFIGGSADENKYLGYIFGASNYSYNSSEVPETLKEIIISDKCTSIGNYALYQCKNITDMTIPESITAIGEDVFYGCIGLKNVYITDIDAWCNIDFSNSFSNPLSYAGNLYVNDILLTEITFGDNFKEIKPFVFYDYGLTSVTISDSVTSIGDSAFENCTGLTEIVIPDSVTFIGDYAFSGCQYLTEIAIPDSLTSIGSSAFSWCTRLKDITIPDSVTSIGSAAFFETEFYSDETKWDNEVLYIGNYLITSKSSSSDKYSIKEGTRLIADNAFDYSSLKEVYIPNSVTSIGDYAFKNCTGLTEIVIPDSVTFIGDYAFSGCRYLTEIVIPDSLTFIGDYAFSGCQYLTEIAIPDSLTTIGLSVFENCARLTNVTIPYGITSIGSKAFYGCSGITSITIPDSVTSIGSSAFKNCTSLESITLPFIGGSDTNEQYIGYIFGASSYSSNFSYVPESLKEIIISNKCTSIGSCALYQCDSITDVTIPKSVTAIGEDVFYCCFGLKNVYIKDIDAWCNIDFSDGGSNPLWYAENLYLNNELVTDIRLKSNLAEIKPYAFYGYDKLETITMPDTVTTIGDDAFYDCGSLTSITIPDSVTSIGDSAFENCTGLTEITIPDSVTSIGSSAFRWCTGLKDITIPDNVTSIGSSAFNNCTSLESITLPFIGGSDTNKQYIGYIFGASSYSYNSSYVPVSLKEIIISDSCTKVVNYAFYNCTNLTDIIIPESVASIGEKAFSGCSSLERITVDENNAFYASENGILYNKDMSKVIWTPAKRKVFLNIRYVDYSGNQLAEPIEVKIGATESYSYESPEINGYVTESEIVSGTMNGKDTVINVVYYEKTVSKSGTCGSDIKWTLYDDGMLVLRGSGEMNDFTEGNAPWAESATDILTVHLGRNITSIGDYAFAGCSNITYADMGYSLNSIGKNAFKGCITLKSVVIPHDVEKIPERAFYGCSALKTVTFSENTEKIDDGAFYGCSSLDKVKIPASVSSICDNAFGDCGALKDVYFYGAPPSVGENALGSAADKVVFYYETVKEWPKNISDGKWNGYTVFPISAITKQNFDSTNAYILRVVDCHNTPLKDAKIRFSGVLKGTTNEEGFAYVTRPDKKVELSVTCDNHLPFTDKEFTPSSYGNSVEYIELSDKPSTVQGIRCNGSSIATSVYVLNCNTDEDVTISVGGYSKYKIIRYEITQGTRLIASMETSENICSFTVKARDFEEGENVLVRMYTADGNTVEAALNIDVVNIADVSQSQILDELSNFNVTIKLGSLGEQKIPLNFKASEKEKITSDISGRTIRVGINLDIKELIDDSKDGLVSWTALQKKINSKMKSFIKPDNGFGFTVCGYVEIEYLGDGQYYVKSNYVKVAVSAKIGFSAQASYFGLVGVYLKASLTGTTSLDLLVDRYELESGFGISELNFGMDNTLSVEGGAFVLWGAGSAGLYSKLNMGFNVGIIPRNGVESVYITGELGFRWSLFWGLKEGSAVIAKGDIYHWPSVQKFSMRRMMADTLEETIGNPESLTTNDRKYLEDRTEWLSGISTFALRGGENKNSYLQANTYDNIVHKIVTCGDTTVMVWLDDNAQRETDNFQTLYYSVYDDESKNWSEPVQLDGNDTFDCEFDLYTDGEKIYVIYTEQKAVMESVDDLDLNTQDGISELIGGVEVRVSVFDGEAFTNPVSLTDNMICETLPELSSVDGVVTAFWSTTENLGMDAGAGENNIYCSRFENGGWTEAVKLITNKNTVSDFTYTSLGEKSYVAYVADKDNNFASNEDKALILKGENTEAVQLDEGNISSVKAATINGKKVLVWNKAGVLYSADTVGNVETLLPEDVTVASDYKVINLSEDETLITFVMGNKTTDFEEPKGSSDIYGVYIRGNSKGNCVVRLTENEGFIDSFSMTEKNGELLTVFTQTFAEVSEDELTSVTNLMCTSVQFDTDITVADVYFTAAQAVPGQVMDIDLTVQNTGTKDVDGLQIKLYDSESAGIFETTVDRYIEAGAELTETVQITVPEKISFEKYTLEVLPLNASDSESGDNAAEISFAYCDLILEAEQKIIGEKNYVVLSVENSGNYEAKGIISVYSSGESSQAVSQIDTSVISPGAFEQYFVDVNGLELDDSGIIRFVVTTDSYDSCEMNNSASVMLFNIEQDGFKNNPDDIVKNPAVTPSGFSYDKFSGGDVSVTITAEEEFFSNLKGLSLNSQYTVSQNIVTVKESYLKKLSMGSHNLYAVFDFGDGKTVERAINIIVSDSTPVYLSGSVAIDGKALTGNTVYADISGIGYSNPSLSYNWTVDGKSVSTDTSYEIKRADYGKQLILIVSGINGFSGSFTATATVDYPTCPTPYPPVVSEITPDCVKLVQSDILEYSTDRINWQSESIFRNLTPNTTYTFYARQKASDGWYASAIGEGVTVTTIKYTVNKPSSPVVEKTGADYIVLEKQDGYLYSKDGKNWQTANTFNNLSPNTEYTFYCKVAETDISYESEISSSVTVKTIKRTSARPSAPVVEKRSSETVSLKFVVGYEYSMDGVNWQNADSGLDYPYSNFINLAPYTEYTFYQRVAETETAFASEISEPLRVRTWKLSSYRPSPPGIKEVTPDSIVFNSDDSYEYRVDEKTPGYKEEIFEFEPLATGTKYYWGSEKEPRPSSTGVWVKGNTVTGLSPNTTYVCYTRIAETDTAYRSMQSNPTTITTPKYTASAPDAPEIKSITDSSVTLKAVEGYEYSIDGINWQTSNVFTGLKPATGYGFRQRVAETATSYASDSSAVKSVITSKSSVSAPAAPTVSELTHNSVVLSFIDGYEYKIDDSPWLNTNSIINLKPNTQYRFYQRVAETATSYASASSPDLIVTTPKAPAGKPVAPVMESCTDRSVTLVPVEGYEYRLGNGSWTTDNVFTGLSPYSEYVFSQRIAENDSTFASVASSAITVRILKSTVSAPDAPVYKSIQDTIVTLVLNTAYEYSINGGEWVKTNRFTGLSPNTEYTFRQRIAETDTVYASEPSAVLKVRTNKSYPSAPVPVIIDEITSTTVTLAAIDGYEYRMGEGKWQDENTFRDLKPNTEYTFSHRIKETETTFPSGEFVSGKVRTLKLTTVAPAAPTVFVKTYNMIALTKNPGCEYRIEGGEWTAFDFFTDLEPGTEYRFYQRFRETDTTYASAESPALIVSTDELINISGGISIIGTPAYGYELSINFESFIGDVRSLEYSWYSDEELIPDADSSFYTVTENDMGKTVTVVIEGTEAYCGTLAASMDILPYIPGFECDYFGHDEEIILGSVEPTCILSGLTEGKVCSRCGFVVVEQTVIPALDHDWRDATCTMPQICNRCEIFQGTELGHTGGTATCIEAAVCDVCGMFYGVADINNHCALVPIEEISPTCTETGLTKGEKCEDCGAVTKEQEIVEKNAHTYLNDCDADCNVCNEIRIPAAHKGGTATCSKKAKCSVCGTEYGSLKAHSYKSTTTMATLSKNGKVENKCSVCDYVSKTTTVYYPKTIKLSATSYTYNGKTKTPTVTVEDSKGNTLKKDTDYTVTYASGRKNTGKYSITITFKGKYSGKKVLYFNILPSKTSKITTTCGTTSIKVSWKKVTGANGYKVELLNSKGKVVKTVTTTKTAYTFKKLSKVTTYKVRVTAYKTIDKKAAYSTTSTTVVISTAPATATLSNVTAGSKSATPAWKTVSGASGYEVQYSTSSKFKSAKTATVKKGSSKKTKIKKLTKGKKYYFKVRAYKTVDGKKVYGAWSAVKSVKVK